MRTFKKNKCDRYLGRLLKAKASFYVKRGVEVDQIIFDTNHFLYSTGNNNFPPEKLFLFNKVNIDVRNFLKNTPFIELPPKQPTQFYNLDYDDTIGIITGTDLDHAFWRIAYIKGYISKKTYEYGIADDKAKVIRLATLGNLGKEDIFDKYENGVLVGQEVKRPENKNMKKIYADIRLTCYYLMYELSVQLGDEFESWATDCIYYRDTPENRKLVHDFFDMHNILYKQLTFNTLDHIEEYDEEPTTNEE
jgi:hypothetical protein